jgi:2',3'-cyclic-nucleotide 2'-phosphodiesterase (5'-nucleotidase family)
MATTRTLIATNDFHSAVPTGRSMLAAVDRWRQRGALVVDAGDFFGGNAFHEFSEGRVEEQLLSRLYDALVPGNHDLADLMRLVDPHRFPPVVCANLAPPSGFTGRWETGLLLPSSELTVGIVGYIGSQAFHAVPSAERAGYTFVEPTASLLKAERDRLRTAGADIVVGVSHSGFQSDVDSQKDGCSFEIVVAGHCHSELYHWASPLAGRHVVKAPENGAGLLRIDLAEDGGHAFSIDCFTPEGTDPLRADGLSDTVGAFEAWGPARRRTCDCRAGSVGCGRSPRRTGSLESRK